jgi:hypothetical protein
MTDQEKKDGRYTSGLKSSEGGRGDPEKASPAAIERYLKGMKYPANKDDLINKAKENEAPSDVMSVLKRFTDHQYHSPIDVSKEVKEVE